MPKQRLRVGDLKDQTGSPYPRPSLYCAECHGLYTAHRGDYFAAREDKILECCGKPLKLVIRRVSIEEVAA